MPARRRPSKIVALDWDVRTLRVVHALVGKRGVKIDRLLSVDIPADVDVAEPDQMGRFIRRVLDQERIGTRHAVVDIPRDQAILKTLHLPAIREEELAGVVAIQIAKELPFPAADGVIDFVVSPGDLPGSTNSDVLVSVARKELVEQYEATFAKAGLRLDRIGLRPYANRIAVCEFLKFALPDRVLFIDLRSTLTEIDVIRNSALVFSRAASVPIPREAILPAESDIESGLSFIAAATDTENMPTGDGERQKSDPADRGLQALVLEVTRSIEAYRVNDPGAQMDHAVIAGDTGIEEAFAEALQRKLGITAELYNPANSFGWTAEEGAAASAFSAALGMALGQAATETSNFNFLDPKRMVSQAKERLRKAPFVAVAALLFIAAGGIVFAKSTKPQRDKLVSLEQQILEIEEKESGYRSFLTFMNGVRAFDQDQHIWVDVLYDVFSILPQNDEIVLTHLDLDQRDGVVVLKAKALERGTATKVVEAFRGFRREGRDAPRFEATFGQQTERPAEKYRFWQDFKITVLDDSGKSKSGLAGSRT